MRHILRSIVLFSLFFTLSAVFIKTSTSPAEARIDIVPQKIIIQSRERGGEFTILNLLDAKGTFRIEMINFSQNENGIYTELNTPLDPQFDPGKVVRLSPRQFSLNPEGRQKVRMSLRKPADLPDGEYRFHVKAIRLAQDDERTSPNGEERINVVANIGVTIPVIVRHGKINVSAKLKDAQIIPPAQTEKNRPELHLRAEREGNASSIGVLEVFWQPQGAKSRRIGQITNANIFTEINGRNFRIPLTELPVGNGQITVRYADAVNKGKIFDEITIQR